MWLTYSNRLTNNISNPNTTPEYENNFSVNFGIIGFGTNIGSDSGAIKSSSDNSLSYGRPFFLNN